MKRLALLLFIALPLFGQTYSIEPASGSIRGGEMVIIHGNFPLGQTYEVYFDTIRVRSIGLTDDGDALVVNTPVHVPGRSKVTLKVNGTTVDPGLTYEFTGYLSVAFERVLLPVFTPPIAGAFGSEFRTELDVVNTAAEPVSIFGLTPCCGGAGNPRVPLMLPGRAALPVLVSNGAPGRFVLVPREEVDRLTANLRAYDTSRSAENFGTEVPLARMNRDFTSQPFALLGVPLDARFRKTLRIYAEDPNLVTIRGLGPVRTVMLAGNTDMFTPAYAEISDFPSGTGLTDVIIEPGRAGAGVWAFITVTNNETQHITTITPRAR